MGLLKKIINYVWSKHFLKHLGLLILTYIVVVSSVIYYLDSHTLHGQKIKVPNLEGKNVDTIDEILSQKKLKYEVIESKYDPKKPEGTILAQDPVASDLSNVFVKEGRTIRLRISKKTQLTEIPNFVSKSERYAIQVLENRGIKYKLKYESSKESNGAVLRQTFKNKPILVGQKIQIGEMITLVVGRDEGGEPIQIPNLVGLSLLEASNRVSKPSINLIPICIECLTKKDSSNAIIESQSPSFIEGASSPFGTTVSVIAKPGIAP